MLQFVKQRSRAPLLVLVLCYIGRVLVFVASINAVYLAVRSVVCCALFEHTHANKDVNSAHISVYDHMSSFPLLPETQHHFEKLTEQTQSLQGLRNLIHIFCRRVPLYIGLLSNPFLFVASGLWIKPALSVPCVTVTVYLLCAKCYVWYLCSAKRCHVRM